MDSIAQETQTNMSTQTPGLLKEILIVWDKFKEKHSKKSVSNKMDNPLNKSFNLNIRIKTCLKFAKNYLKKINNLEKWINN